MTTFSQEKAAITHIEGALHDNHSVRIGIAVGRFNGFLVESLVEGAIDALVRHGVLGKNIHVVRVPGAFELPLTAKKMAESNNYDAIVVLGAIIRGATPHFDIVASESAKGLSQVALQHGIAVINGILTTENIEQTIERAGTKAGNKGYEAAMTALEMISVFNKI
ncbi:6,7-dimethyl-8-ribityllumazine synthase [Moraxella cuniculi DSM 21768]|uniref:6,7-dimethyl-8-ribityllumazine synthase n=2 Tax=Moraxella cuniculi TaxID=34061 RepID=A0A1N7FAL6_9GAMM|nr:6,7-dimethyl-8-ribityllumazine synthase [Moraxella cuniculi]OOS03550.1 6,7-dimethyl-8-ribityllumazine synthase [Moraxella cuniculi]SIR97418.1 6,7-dimethyl-8-ribityllumazine synthase [Moraxella cuniculi DSM 21768]VEG12430.1 6,7-dimethyl-8-ribityllumazine synthase [Moraxella cuniculi]